MMPSELFRTNIGNTSTGYKVILSYVILNESTNLWETKYAEIDVQEDGLDIKSNVELTSFPTLQGHHISDHIYRLPIEIGIKGEFADNGLKAQDWTGQDRLTRIQSEFEACQRAGIKFKIVTIRNNNASNKSNWRFLARQNMVLTSINWQQHQHSLSFSFNFKEAMSSKLQKIDVKTDVSDPNLPVITDLSAASLVGEVISSNDVIGMTIEVLRNLNLVNDATFLRCMATGAILMGTSMIISAAVVGSVLLVVAGVCSSVPVVGWIVAAACALAAGIMAIFSWAEAAKRAEQLAYYRNLGEVFLIEDDMTEDEKDEVVRNFITFLGKVKTTVDNSLTEIAVYRIGKADRQECVLTVNGSYYVQQIEKNDDDLSYRIKSLYLGHDCVKSLPKIVALESFNDCTENESTIYFRDRKGAAGSTYRVYIINRVAYKQEMMNEPTTEDRLTAYAESDLEKYNAEKEQLLDFAFVVSPYPLTELTDKVSAAIRKAVG